MLGLVFDMAKEVQGVIGNQVGDVRLRKARVKVIPSSQATEIIRGQLKAALKDTTDPELERQLKKLALGIQEGLQSNRVRIRPQLLVNQSHEEQSRLDNELRRQITSRSEAEDRTSASLKRIKNLLIDGANPNYVYCNQSFLERAINKHDYELLKLLLQSGADPNLETKRGIPIREALDIGDLKSIEILVKYGADLNRKPTNSADGLWDSLSYAMVIRSAKPEIIEFLVKHGAKSVHVDDDFNVRGKLNVTIPDSIKEVLRAHTEEHPGWNKLPKSELFS
tara:strand:+ start:395 stop:1234 length:840 start_codon:yes stop_codon:yes gene_type:complete